METHLDTARRVIRTEAAGLAALESALTGPLAALATCEDLPAHAEAVRARRG